MREGGLSLLDEVYIVQGFYKCFWFKDLGLEFENQVFVFMDKGQFGRRIGSQLNVQCLRRGLASLGWCMFQLKFVVGFFIICLMLFRGFQLGDGYTVRGQ